MQNADHFLITHHFKDKNPSETVEQMQRTLQELGLELEEIWGEPTKTGTHSLRLRVTGIPLEVGSNGKGSSREYARASAYGELCERLQNQLFALCKGYATEEKKEYTDEQYMTLQEAIAADSSFLPLLMSSLHTQTEDARAKERQLEELFGSKPVLMRPFYSWKKKRIVQVAWTMAGKFYGSNGMSAGNTMEEALVQGLSEIIERHVQRMLMQHPSALPDIPEEYIQKYEHVYQMYCSLKNQKKYEVYVKDCSLGEGYPVAGLILVRKGTSCFGVKLGCHPNIGIAMERCFTEAFQGLNEDGFSGTSRLDLSNYQTSHSLNIYNTFKTAYGQYPWQLLQNTDSSAQIEASCTSVRTNSEMLQTLVHLLASKGYDLLFRDVSFLGIPSYQILVPGMSELLPISEKMVRAANTMNVSAALLKNPSRLTPEDCNTINLSCRFWKNSVLENNLVTQYNVPLQIELPGNEHGHGLVFLEAMTYYAQQKTDLALQAYNNWLQAEEKYQEKPSAFYYVMHHYLAAVAHKAPLNQVLPVLEKFYGKSLVEQAAAVLSKPESCMEALYPQLDCYHCCSCPLSAQCGFPAYKKILTALWNRQRATGFSQSHLVTDFERIFEENQYGDI